MVPKQIQGDGFKFAVGVGIGESTEWNNAIELDVRERNARDHDSRVSSDLV